MTEIQAGGAGRAVTDWRNPSRRAGRGGPYLTEEIRVGGLGAAGRQRQRASAWTLPVVSSVVMYRRYVSTLLFENDVKEIKENDFNT